MSQAVAKCQQPVCARLREEEAKLARLRVDAQAAETVYAPPGRRTPPPGYREATAKDLKEMNLSPAMLERPRNAKGEQTDFRAAVFVHEKTGERIVAFKGTETAGDWGNNLQQGAGRQSSYYTQAQTIAARVKTSGAAGQTHFTGHSLGGGLASAASRSSGLPATTFNAASLHKDTVPKPNMSGRIDAVSVRGDPLTRLNESTIGTTAGTRPYKLDPPSDLAGSATANIPWYKLIDRAKAVTARQLALHGMDTAKRALARRSAQVQAALRANRC